MLQWKLLFSLIALDPSWLSVLVLITCVLCLYMVFFFGRRLQNSAYLRDSLIESTTQQEMKVLLRELDDRALNGPLDPQSPPPEGYGPTRRLWRSDQYGTVKPSTWGRRPGETEEQKQTRLAQEEAQKRFDDLSSDWEKEEKVRYNQEKEKLEQVALRRARDKVPTSFDISLLGGGYAFLLEFSTVIVIIFTLLILGVLKLMEGREISTILAAIAGYVLGKATYDANKPKPASPDALRIVAGESGR